MGAMAKQLEGKSSRNRNRNSSMRKSVGSSSPKKREQVRKTSEKEMSPKKEAKKGKSPSKEVKIEKNPPTKSGKENNPPNTGNLMGKDKKKNLYLLAAAHDKEVKLNDVAKKVGAKELRFGDESVMLELLGVSQGRVTAYALANDKNKAVKFI